MPRSVPCRKSCSNPLPGTLGRPILWRAGYWQAARPLGSFALCGCTVGPGFEFEDFSFLRDSPELAARLRFVDPDAAALT